MYCNECGRKIPDSFIYCGYCGTKIVAFSNHCNDNTYKATYNRNPILNSPNDITDELINHILDNSLDSLTINYEFTRAKGKESVDDWEHEQIKNNPFFRANKIKEIAQIKFKLILGSNVHSLAGAFREFKKLEFVNLCDTSGITDMGEMFWNALSFNQPIGSWNTSNVTSMRFMFVNAKSFNQYIGEWDTSNVTDMRFMFRGAESFNQSIGNWNTAKVKDMDGLFYGAIAFNQSIKKWDMANVVSKNFMFEGAASYDPNNCDIVEREQSLQKICFVVVETTGIEDDDEILRISVIDYDENILFDSFVRPSKNKLDYEHLKQDLLHELEENKCDYSYDTLDSYWVGTAYNGITPPMVISAPNFSEIESKLKALFSDMDVVAFKMEFVEKFLGDILSNANSLYCCQSNLSDLVGDLVFQQEVGSYMEKYYMDYTFKEHYSMEDGLCLCGVEHNLNHEDSINKCVAIKKIWEVLRKDFLIYHTDETLNPILNSPDDITDELRVDIINNRIKTLTINYEFTRFWDRTKNEFYLSDSWEQEQYRTNPFWRLSLYRIEFKIILGENVHSLAGAFAWQTNLTFINLEVTSNITDMRGMFFMAKVFNQPIGNWDTYRVKDMSHLFEEATSFNQPLRDWNTYHVTDMSSMFRNAANFDQFIGNWYTSKVTNMSSMFRGASSFNQRIDGWDTSRVKNMSHMFENADSFNQSLENWNVSRVKDMSDMFSGAFFFNKPFAKWNISKFTNNQ